MSFQIWAKNYAKTPSRDIEKEQQDKLNKGPKSKVQMKTPPADLLQLWDLKESKG